MILEARHLRHINRRREDDDSAQDTDRRVDRQMVTRMLQLQEKGLTMNI